MFDLAIAYFPGMILAQVMPIDPNENMAVSLALSALAFIITIIIGRPFVTYLRQRKVGKKVRAELQQHLIKTGTPTMGGLMFTISVVIVTLVFNTVGRLSMLLPIGVLVAASILGAIDDGMNLVGGKKSGMTARFKFIWLTVFAFIAALILFMPDPWGLGLHHMYVPFFGRYNIGWAYLPVATVSIVAMSNAVNLTDGLDSLAAITAAIAFCAYGIIAYRQGQLGVVTFCFTMVGGKKSGMTARFKFIWLTVFAFIAALILFMPDPWGLGLHHMYVPFFGRYNIGWAYLPVATVSIVAMSNAVNLTDGLDSLAAITAAIAFCAYGIIAYRQGQLGVVTFCFTMVGGLAGFLWFNAHPAQVIMGDTGALAIGGALATAAFMTGQWLLLPIVGAVFVAEMLSVMLQVGYFKATKGKRLFKMAPLHHHFEVLGWSETQVMMRFALAGMMAGLLGVAFALL